MASEPDDKTKAMLFEHPQYIPVGLGILPSAWMTHREKLRAIADRHPLLFNNWNTPQGGNYDKIANPTYVAGEHIDAWGCVWSNVHDGRESIVTSHPVPTRADVHKLKLPTRDDGFPHGFMYLRLADLRGFEELMVDFAEDAPELQMLIDIVLKHNLRQRDLRLAGLAGKPPEITYFGDDLGMQTSLAMGPEKWRKYLKPCFAAIYGPVRAAGHYVYMHTDGHIHEIIPDLVECGVNVVNPQYRANGLDNLVRVCKGKVCLDLDLDRQLFPFCTPAEIDKHIRECVEALGSPEGGLWLKAEIDDGVPLENVEAVCVALEKYRGWFIK